MIQPIKHNYDHIQKSTFVDLVRGIAGGFCKATGMGNVDNNGIDIEIAMIAIEEIEMLRDKTKGNLTEYEEFYIKEVFDRLGEAFAIVRKTKERMEADGFKFK